MAIFNGTYKQYDTLSDWIVGYDDCGTSAATNTYKIYRISDTATTSAVDWYDLCGKYDNATYGKIKKIKYEWADTTTIGNASNTYGTCPTWVEYEFEKKLIRPIDPRQRLREIIRQRTGPGIIVVDSKRRSIPTTQDVREIRARQTLARMVGPDRYRRFLKDGFITAHNRVSGLVYQIFTGHELTKVYENGKQIAKLCVVLKGSFAPTDTLIVRYLMCLNDEKRFWEIADQGSATRQFTDGLILPPSAQKAVEPPKPLTEIFEGIKQKVA